MMFLPQADILFHRGRKQPFISPGGVINPLSITLSLPITPVGIILIMENVIIMPGTKSSNNLSKKQMLTHFRHILC